MRSKTWSLYLLHILALVILTLGFAGCGGDDDDDANSNTTPPPGATGTISGVVSNLGGSVLSGASVWVGSGTPVQTNEQGYFVLSSVATGNTVVAFVADGYMPTYRNVTVLANQTTHLPEVGLALIQEGTIAAASGGTLDAGVAEVTFPANAFVTENGTAYNGDVTVEMAAMQPQMEGFYAAFPGEFEGVRNDGTTVPFVSFGFMDVNLMNADKSAPVRLAPGVTAELRMEIYNTAKATPPATIPMWYYDPATGRWIEDGSATRDGSVYVTDVDHFTTWNWDMPVETICNIQGSVVDLDGDPVADARVFSRGAQSGIMDEVYTNAAGVFSVRGLVNEEFHVWAMKGSYASPTSTVTLNDCPYALTTALELLEPAFSITLRWGQNPNDLDSHLIIPAAWTDTVGDTYHLYYGHMGALDTDPYTQLDTDDTSSFGPEIISSFRYYEGTYSYYIHHFSGSATIATSGATVLAEINGQSRTYAAATAGGTGDPRYWHVFDFTVAANGAVTITDVNAFGLPAKAAGFTMVPKN